jgi:hypothetical protein
VTLILGMSKPEGIYLSVDHRVIDPRRMTPYTAQCRQSCGLERGQDNRHSVRRGRKSPAGYHAQVRQWFLVRKVAAAAERISRRLLSRSLTTVAVIVLGAVKR